MVYLAKLLQISINSERSAEMEKGVRRENLTYEPLGVLQDGERRAEEFLNFEIDKSQILEE